MDWDDAGTHRRVYVDQPELLFGRHGSMDLQTDNPTVGRRQARFSRVGDAWFVEDTGSPGGTFIDQERVVGAQRLETGMIVRSGGALFLILDTAHEPEASEETGGLRTDELFASRGLTAAIGFTLRATFTTGATRATLADAIATTHGSHDDPVSLVHACAAFEARLAEETQIRAHLARVALDVHALAMLRERSAPAVAAWTWLTQRFSYRPLHPEALVCGLTYKGLPFEPSPAIVDAAPEGGMLIWVREGPQSHLLRLTTTDGIARMSEQGAVLLARVLQRPEGVVLHDIGTQHATAFPVGAELRVGYFTMHRVR